MSDYYEDYPEPDSYDPYEYDDLCDEREYEDICFADPGGNSALRAATRDNPRDYPCPTCGDENRLTAQDVAQGYQCNHCADQCERGW